MLRALLLASVLVVPASAQSLPKGAFAGTAGAQKIDIIFGPGQAFSIAVSMADGCAVSGGGHFEKVTPGMYRAVVEREDGPGCELYLTENRRGFNVTQSGGNCSVDSAMTCGFYGIVDK